MKANQCDNGMDTTDGNLHKLFILTLQQQFPILHVKMTLQYLCLTSLFL